MPPSKTRPDATFSAFETDETLTSVAQRFGIPRPTLRRWWVKQFGEEAYAQRADRKTSPEAKKQQRKVYRETHKEQIRAGKQRSYTRNRPELLARQKKYRTENPDRVQASNRRQYLKNAPIHRARAKTYRTEHLIEVKTREKLYYKAHPVLCLFKGAKARARRFKLPFNLTVDDIERCIPVDGRCPLTMEPFERGVGRVGPRSMTLDRKVPALGYVVGNIAVISHQANTIKQNCLDPEVFRRVAAYVEAASLHTPVVVGFPS